MRKILPEQLAHSSNRVIQAYQDPEGHFPLRVEGLHEEQIYKDLLRGLTLFGQPLGELYFNKYGNNFELENVEARENVDALIKEKLNLTDEAYQAFKAHYSQETYSPLKKATDSAVNTLAMERDDYEGVLKVNYALLNNKPDSQVDLFLDEDGNIRIRNTNHFGSVSDGSRRLYHVDVTVSCEALYDPVEGFFLDPSSVRVDGEHEELFSQLIQGSATSDDLSFEPMDFNDAMDFIAGPYGDNDFNHKLIRANSDTCRLHLRDVNERLNNLNAAFEHSPLSRPKQKPAEMQAQRSAPIPSKYRPGGFRDRMSQKKARAKQRWHGFWHRDDVQVAVSEEYASKAAVEDLSRYNDIKDNLMRNRAEILLQLCIALDQENNEIARELIGDNVKLVKEMDTIEKRLSDRFQAENFTVEQKNKFLNKTEKLLSQKQMILQTMQAGHDIGALLQQYRQLSSELFSMVGVLDKIYFSNMDNDFSQDSFAKKEGEVFFKNPEEPSIYRDLAGGLCIKGPDTTLLSLYEFNYGTWDLADPNCHANLDQLMMEQLSIDEDRYQLLKDSFSQTLSYVAKNPVDGKLMTLGVIAKKLPDKFAGVLKLKDSDQGRQFIYKGEDDELYFLSELAFSTLEDGKSQYYGVDATVTAISRLTDQGFEPVSIEIKGEDRQLIQACFEDSDQEVLSRVEHLNPLSFEQSLRASGLLSTMDELEQGLDESGWEPHSDRLFEQLTELFNTYALVTQGMAEEAQKSPKQYAQYQQRMDDQGKNFELYQSLTRKMGKAISVGQQSKIRHVFNEFSDWQLVEQDNRVPQKGGGAGSSSRGPGLGSSKG